MIVNEPNTAATGMEDAAIDAKAKEMFDDYKDALAAPWERQWTGTRSYWRQKAIAALAAQPAPGVGGDARAMFALQEIIRSTNGGYFSSEMHKECVSIAKAALSTRPAESVAQGGIEFLKDPSTVHAMMLRGQIAIPSWRNIVDLRGEVPNGEDVQLARIAELQEQLAATPATGSGGEVGAFIAELDAKLDAVIEILRSQPASEFSTGAQFAYRLVKSEIAAHPAPAGGDAKFPLSVPTSLLKAIKNDETMGFAGQKAFHVFVGRLEGIWKHIAALSRADGEG